MKENYKTSLNWISSFLLPKGENPEASPHGFLGVTMKWPTTFRQKPYMLLLLMAFLMIGNFATAQCTPPVIVGPSNISETGANINWMNTTGETYVLEVYTDSGYTVPFATYPAISGGSATVDGVTSGLTYYYRVKVTGCTTYTTGSFSAVNTYSPLDIASGYSHDVIANGVGYASTSTTGAVDAGNYSYLTVGYKATSGSTATSYGVPANRYITSTANTAIKYMLAPYSSNNSLRIAAQNGEGTLSLAKPVQLSNLYLAVAGGDGAVDVSIRIWFSDGGYQDVTANVTDWGTGSVPTATPSVITALGRVSVSTNSLPSTGTFRIYQITIPITTGNQAKMVSAVRVIKTGAGATSPVANIFAVTGQVLGVYPTLGTVSSTATTATGTTLNWSLTTPGYGSTTANVTYSVETYSDLAYTALVGTPVTGLTATTYSPSGLTPGTQYYFKVKAINNYGTSAGTATVTTAYLPCTVPTVPGTVTLSTSSATVAGTITPSGSTGYLVVRSTSATLSAGPVNNSTYTTSSTIGGGNVVAVGTSPTFTNTGLTGTTTYYYFVYAYNTGTTCVGPVYSTTASAASVTTCIATPLIVGASNVKNSSANLNWTKVTGLGTTDPIIYTVEVYTDSNYTTAFTGSPFTGLTVARQTITGLTANATYYWRVKAEQTGTCTSDWATSSFSAVNTYTPIDVNGYTTDVIANGTGIANLSTTGAIDAVSNAYMSLDYKQTATSTALAAGAGLPLNRNLTGSISGLKFFLEDYAQNNAIRMGAQNESATINFTVPLKLTDMYIAVTGGSGAPTVSANITFEGGTTQLTSNLVFTDWYGAGTTTIPSLISGIGRVNRSNTVGAPDPGASKIFQITIPILAANQDKKITGVTFTKTSTGATEPVANIFAISGKVIGDCPTMASVNTTAVTSSSATINAVIGTAGEGLTAANVWYKIEVFTNSNFTGAVTGSPFTTAAGTAFKNVTGLSPFTAYYYRVTAVNSACESTAVTGSFTTLMAECATPAAATFAVTGTSATTVTGTITAPATAPTGYLVIRSTSATLSAAPANFTTYTAGTSVGGGIVVYVGTSTAFNDTTATSNTLYYYYVYSYNSGTTCSGPIFSTTNATTSATTCVAQTLVVGGSNIKNSSATLNWTSVNGGNAIPVTYTLEVFTDPGYTTLLVPAFTGLTVSKQSISGLTASASYYYRVSTVSASACTTTYSTGNFVAQNGYTPIDVTSGGYNTDVIANGSGAAQYSATHAVDATGAGHSYMSLDYKSALGVATTTGLPVNRFISSTTTSGLNFIVPDYSGNNCLRIEGINGTGTLTFETPVKLTNVYIATTGGSGALTISAEILFEDGGTSQISNNVAVPDWVTGTTNPLTGTLGRVSRIDAVGTPETGTAAKIFQVAIAVDAANQTRKVSGVKFTKTSAGDTEPVLNIFAISGKIIGDCPTLNTATATAPTYSTANFTWALSTAGDGYTAADVSYKIEVFTNANFTGAVTGSPFTTAAGATSYSLNGLSAVTTYYYKVTAINSACESNIVSGSFATPVSCPAPTAISATGGFSTGTITWTGTAAGNYDYYYSATNTAPTAATAGTNVSATTVNLTGLPSSVTYYVWVRAHCSETDKSTWASGGSFYTGYCTPAYTQACDTHRVSVINVPLASFNTTMASGCTHDYTATQIAVTAGSTYTFNVTVTGYTGLGMVADYNNDGDFSDAGEVLGLPVYMEAGTVGDFTHAVTVTIPSGTVGLYRIRFWNRLANGGNGDTPCGAYNYGTWVDYTLNVTAPCYTWTGTTSTAWSTGTNWCGGLVPAATSDVVIPALASGNTNYPVVATGTAYASNLTIATGATLTVNTGATLSVENTLGNSGTLLVQNNGALIQGASTATSNNSGNITVKKDSNSLFRLDYTLWSSPVSGTQTLYDFSPLTNASRFYEYKYANDPVTGLPVEQYFGVASTSTFTQAKGYLIRMPNTDAAVNATAGTSYNAGTLDIVYPGSFTGLPNNGTITYPASTVGNKYTAVGNPYPSPISLVDFYTENSGAIENGSAIYFWRKKNNAAVSSYAYITLAGLTANGASGTAGYTEGGQGQSGFYTAGNSASYLISQGQGFIVKTKDNPTTTNITFKNSMRRGAPGATQGFFKSAGATMSRYWLNISGDNNGFSQAAVAYMEGGTLGLDYGYDGKKFTDGGSVALYSLAADTNLAIQARPAFEVSDVVPMGFEAVAAGQFTISLDHFDGLFEGDQDIYIKDNLEGLTHNLKNSAYTFTSEAGTFTGRFEVVYTTQALGTDTPVLTANSVIVYKQGTAININSGTTAMTGVTIYDIRGRKLYSQSNINATQTAITGLQVQQEVLIVEVNTVKGKVSKRLVF